MKSPRFFRVWKSRFNAFKRGRNQPDAETMKRIRGSFDKKWEKRFDKPEADHSSLIERRNESVEIVCRRTAVKYALDRIWLSPEFDAEKRKKVHAIAKKFKEKTDAAKLIAGKVTPATASRIDNEMHKELQKVLGARKTSIFVDEMIRSYKELKEEFQK